MFGTGTRSGRPPGLVEASASFSSSRFPIDRKWTNSERIGAALAWRAHRLRFSSSPVRVQRLGTLSPGSHLKETKTKTQTNASSTNPNGITKSETDVENFSHVRNTGALGRERGGGGRERDVIHFANRSRLCFFVNWFVKVPSGNRLFLLWDDVVVLFSSFFLFWASLCLSLVTGSDETFHSAHTPNWASRGTTKTKQWDEKQTKARPWNALIC